ncbi:hypothetical protein K491DRAFT_712831 [Lophiostoma macrostomum CBS 122681]|uniref:SigF-like NTF2-like domain-containing protein n=1 Tax=Lophiostoma macrostomum CBS 122681 TaxID=1314788 RepID=A0A6A6TK21_9PLEO|nr:hypothetical protein K491DRAFT_712831 [Lophiostoma macrostomum CBS 122681]
MDNPALDIAHVIVRLLDPPTPASQIRTIQKYFSADASFAHPLCYIESTPDSRDRIIRVYNFLHLVAPTCAAKIRRQSFHDTKGKMSLEIEISPILRGVQGIRSLLGRAVESMGADGLVQKLGLPREVQAPVIPVHVFLNLGRVEEGGLVGPWRIRRQEVVFQPMDVLYAVRLDWVGGVLYFFVWLLVMAVVMVGQLGRAWNQKDFSIYEESTTLAKDGYEALVVPPKNALVWSYGRAKDTAAWSYDQAKTTALDRYAWAKVTARDRLTELHRRHEPRLAVVKHAVRLVSWKLWQKLVM